MPWTDLYHEMDEYAVKFGYQDLSISYSGVDGWVVNFKDRDGETILQGSGPTIKAAVDDLYKLLMDE